MFNSGILDVVIGVIVVYLQLSLVCTAFHELVALLLKKRATELEKGILGLLNKPALVSEFYAHPLIQGLRPEGRKPSYIPSQTFSLALMDMIRHHSFDGADAAAVQAVDEKLAARDAAKAALDVATNALTAAQSVSQAATSALAAASDADKLQKSKEAEEATGREAAAKTAIADAQSKLDAAEINLTQVQNYKRDTAAALEAETAAEAAEKAANAAAALDPKSKDQKTKDLKEAAIQARQKANDAAYRVTPSASSLITDARSKIAGVPGSVMPIELKTALLALMDNAGSNLDKAQANLEHWFDAAMDRVSGTYKRKSHMFVVIIAVLITVLSNVDTLQVADSLSHDKALRDTIVAAAPELAKADKDLVDKQRGITPEGASPSPSPGSSPTALPKAATTNPAATPSPTATPISLPTPSLSGIKTSLDELNKYGLPIGYIRVCTPVEEKAVDSCANAAESLLANTDEKLKQAQAKSQKAESDFKTATENAGKATKENSAAMQAALAQAKTDRDKALDDLKNAQDSRDKANARVEKIKQLQTALLTAEAELQADPQNGDKQKAVNDARRNAALTTACPKCRKASDLSPDELKRRLPTTHDFGLRQNFWDAVGALVSDSWDLLYAHWLGWALTAFAVSLGAPFWFDMLNKLIVVRSTVKPKEKSPDEKSKS